MKLILIVHCPLFVDAPPASAVLSSDVKEEKQKLQSPAPYVRSKFLIYSRFKASEEKSNVADSSCVSTTFDRDSIGDTGKLFTFIYFLLIGIEFGSFHFQLSDPQLHIAFGPKVYLGDVLSNRPC